jgi:hypothetical protein
MFNVFIDIQKPAKYKSINVISMRHSWYGQIIFLLLSDIQVNIMPMIHSWYGQIIIVIRCMFNVFIDIQKPAKYKSILGRDIMKEIVT